jgi:integrase
LEPPDSAATQRSSRYWLASCVPGWTTSSTPIPLLTLNGLRVSEATGANIEALGTECGYRTLTITRKGGKVVTISLAPRTARVIDLAIGEWCEGPILGLVLG